MKCCFTFFIKKREVSFPKINCFWATNVFRNVFLNIIQKTTRNPPIGLFRWQSPDFFIYSPLIASTAPKNPTKQYFFNCPSSSKSCLFIDAGSGNASTWKLWKIIRVDIPALREGSALLDNLALSSTHYLIQLTLWKIKILGAGKLVGIFFLISNQNVHIGNCK